MRFTFLTTSFFSILLFTACLKEKENASQQAPAFTDVSSFTWLQGTWKMPLNSDTLFETWKLLSDTLMEGQSYILKSKGQDTLFLEKVQLECRNNSCYYTVSKANSSGEPPVSFKITASGNQRFVAENPEHDFPQRINYQLNNMKQLAASVEGKNKGKDEKSEYLFERCRSMEQSLILHLFSAFNEHNWEKFASCYASKAGFLDPSFGKELVYQSHSQIIEKYKGLQQIFPDIRDEVKNLYECGDHIIVEFVSHGTAGKQSFSLPICTIFTIKNGKIITDKTYYDNE